MIDFSPVCLGIMAAAGPTKEINRLSSLFLRHEEPPLQSSEELLLTTLIWLGTQYVTDEMIKGLFVPGRKIGKHSAQISASPIRGFPERSLPLETRAAI
jgi:hypothetical protein